MVNRFKVIMITVQNEITMTCKHSGPAELLNKTFVPNYLLIDSNVNLPHILTNLTIELFRGEISMILPIYIEICLDFFAISLITAGMCCFQQLFSTYLSLQNECDHCIVTLVFNYHLSTIFFPCDLDQFSFKMK